MFPYKHTARTLGVRAVAQGGVIAALYIVLTAMFAPISFGEVQFRISEALTLLPVLWPVSVPGLFVGCFFSNLLFGQPWQDVVFGSLATLIAAVLTHRLRKNIYLAALMPVVVNGLVIGLMLSLLYQLPLFMTILTVSLGEAGVCYVLGVPLIKVLKTRLGQNLPGS
ncbi:MAG TPA: QueT transporter family protein [Clostridiales bacterium]|jgi:uncharacterized membrane protein|nr:QueT transporter family protein [Clostridiales bacterium]